MALVSVNRLGYCHRMAGNASGASQLAEAKRLAVVEHVLAAARRLVLTAGLNVTMDQLADASEVSRRTLFRHFASREALVAAAFAAGMAGYRDQLPHFGGDIDSWLFETCHTVHRMNSTIGLGFFELASRADLPPELAAAETNRRNEFRAAMDQIATTIWRSSNADGPPPASLTRTVTLHLSPFFTAAATIDAELSWEAAADAAHQALTSVLRDLFPTPTP